MYQNVNSNKNAGDCLKCVQKIHLPPGGGISSESVISVPDVPGSTSCLIQFCVDPDDLPGGMELSDLNSKPIVTVSEGPDVINPDDYNLDVVSAFTIPGVKVVNFGTYLVEAPKNLNQVQIIPSVKAKIYCVFTFYK